MPCQLPSRVNSAVKLELASSNVFYLNSWFRCRTVAVHSVRIELVAAAVARVANQCSCRRESFSSRHTSYSRIFCMNLVRTTVRALDFCYVIRNGKYLQIGLIKIRLMDSVHQETSIHLPGGGGGPPPKGGLFSALGKKRGWVLETLAPTPPQNFGGHPPPPPLPDISPPS